jgi:ABC-type multidrug transport system ATPase subunit/pSer/pThr/pTyr-binding forkhead associated (FHA) protein
MEKVVAASKTPKPIRVWLFGSDPQCDVVLDQPMVSPRHCLLAHYDQGYAVEDLNSGTGTWLNGRVLAPRQPEWVTSHDRILLGGSVVLPWPENGARVNPKPGPPIETRRMITIGRGSENTAVLDYPMISWNHARLTLESNGKLFLEDLKSTNGTSLGHAENKISRAEVTAEDSVFFGSFKIRVSRLLEPGKLALGGAVEETVPFRGTEMVIGRDPQCDYPLSFPMISWHHAKLSKVSGGFEIEDLGSRNGTFVDGARISGRVTLKAGSEIGLGSFRFRLLEDGNLGKRNHSGNVTVEAVSVVVEISRSGTRRRLLDPVSLTVFPSELVALMGPAGAGKTTLLKAINGYTPPAAGQVLFNGEDLYANQDQFRLQVGYVPQDDILHPQLTVKEALYYTAKLRTDLRDDEIDARIMQILEDLNIDDIGNRLIGSPERKVISGGQRKRVNIAMELLSDPSVLFLDEPTSGLSSYDAAQVMRVLRRMADGGKTVFCTIHQPSVDIFREFDSLIMVARDKGDNAGMLVYFGPAYPESIRFFNPRTAGPSTSENALSPEILMSGLAGRPATEWANIYQSSSQKKEFVEARAGQIVSDKQSHGDRRKTEFGFRQLLTLSRRNMLLKLRDKTQSLILLAQAPLFAALLTIVFRELGDKSFGDPADWAQFCGNISSVHFLMVVAAVWFGCNNAARDIVGETAIFQRERMVNLKLPSYVFSKMAVLSLVCVSQCLALLGIVYEAAGLSGPFMPLLLVLVASSFVGAAIGLLISALSPTTETAIAFLPVVLLPFILLGGGIKPLHEMPKTAQWIAAATPTRWAYEANLLQETKDRHSAFTNEAAKKLADCQAAMTQCRAASPPAGLGQQGQRVEKAPSILIETDIAQAAFPVSDGRSTFSRSIQALGIFLGIFLILILSVLNFKAAQ